MTFEELSELALRGSLEHQLEMGNRYARGTDVEQDQDVAFAWWASAGQSGLKEAQFMVGQSYLFGQGVERDQKLAYEWFACAAKNGHPKAQYYFGCSLLPIPGYATENACLSDALIWIQEAAKQQVTDAYAILGNIYSSGQYGVLDLDKAKHYLALATECGSGESSYTLGQMHMNDEHLGLNDAEAFACFKHSAELGFSLGHYELANCYLQGVGTATDESLAFEHYQWASEQDIPMATFRMGLMYGAGRGTEKNTQKAVACIQKAVEQGDTEATLSLAMMYQQGKDVEVDEDRSRELLREITGPVVT